MKYVGLILGWVLGIFFLLPGVIFIFTPEQRIAGVLFTLLGAFLLPPVRKFIRSKTKKGVQASEANQMRLQFLEAVKNGTPLTIPKTSAILQKEEIAYWSEPSSLIEERVVNRRYVGGSSGFSFRIAKGVSYRVGSSRGHLVSDSADVPVSSGDLSITSNRVIFHGDSKSFTIRLGNLLGVDLFNDGIRLTDEKGNPRVVKFSKQGSADVVGATLSYALNQERSA